MITIKEEFYEHDKTKLAYRLGGADALLLWHLMKAYASKRGKGFVPNEAIANFPLQVRNVRRAMDALVNCGELQDDGTRKPGLVERVTFGWELHDYGDHAASSEELEERKRSDRERKQLQRDRARLRLALVEQGLSREEAEQRVRVMSHQEVTDAVSALSQDMSRDTSQDTSAGGHSDGHEDCPGGVPHAQAPASAPAPARTGVHAGARAPARPNPTQPNPSLDVEDDARGASDVPCPPDLGLDPAERTNLAMGLGMTDEFIDRATPVLRARFASDSPRTPQQWRRSLITALTTGWNNPTKRDEYLGKAPPPKSGARFNGRGPVQPNHGSVSDEEFLARQGAR